MCSLGLSCVCVCVCVCFRLVLLPLVVFTVRARATRDLRLWPPPRSSSIFRFRVHQPIITSPRTGKLNLGARALSTLCCTKSKSPPQLVTLEHEHLVLVTHNSNDQAPMVFATETGGDGVWKPWELNDGWDNVIEYGAFVVTYLHTRRLARQGI